MNHDPDFMPSFSSPFGGLKESQRKDIEIQEVFKHRYSLKQLFHFAERKYKKQLTLAEQYIRARARSRVEMEPFAKEEAAQYYIQNL